MKSLIITAVMALGLAAPALAAPAPKTAPAPAPTYTYIPASTDEFYAELTSADALVDTTSTVEDKRKLMMRCGGPPPKIARSEPAPTIVAAAPAAKPAG